MFQPNAINSIGTSIILHILKNSETRRFYIMKKHIKTKKFPSDIELHSSDNYTPKLLSRKLMCVANGTKQQGYFVFSTVMLTDVLSNGLWIS